MIFIYLTIGLWAIMAFYWIIEAKINSQTNFSSEIFSLAKLIFSFFIIYLPLLTDGWLAKELYISNNITNVLGVVLCGVGVIFAMWGRNKLEKNWSGRILIQEQHSFIQTGPYKIVRHPQYTGSILAFFGTSLLLGYIFGFIWSIFLMFGLIVKAKMEEKILANKFPNEYSNYKKKVKMIIPHIY